MVTLPALAPQTAAQGVAVGDDPPQTKPDLQGPVTILLPGSAQYMPAVHPVHDEGPLPPAVARKVPAGHGVGVVEPAPQ